MTVSAPRPLRVAVVGAGYVATHHLAALSRLDFVKIVGLCDSHLPAAEALAKRFRIGTVAATLADLAGTTPDVVHVLTPPASHAALAIEAMDMGCHVLVEKPMADTAADCERMLAKSRETGLKLGVNHSDLFDPALMRALEAARNGDIGEVLSVDIIRNSEYPPYAGGPLPGMVTQGSYPFRDLGVHGLYTIEAFIGSIAQVDVQYQSRGGDPNLGFDEWQAQARSASGIGRLLLSWNARPMENRLFVRGTRGIIEVDRFTQVCRIHRVLPGPKFIGIILNAFFGAAKDVFRIPMNVLRFATGRLKPSPGIQRGAEAFARAVRDGETPPFTAEDGLRLARLLDPLCAAPDRARLQQLEARHADLPPVDARVTGAAKILGVSTPVRARVEYICRAFSRLYPGKTVDLQVPANLAVGVEEQDFDEMVGNLLENAFKWSASQLRISSAELGGWITLRIEDDGPGMSEDQIAKAVLRGVRLDEKVPGSGLGLNIVSDLAEAYRGSLIMGRAELGGLAASLSLPKVARVDG